MKQLDPELVKFFIENEESIQYKFDHMNENGYRRMIYYTYETTWHFTEHEFKLFQRDSYLYKSKLYKSLA